MFSSFREISSALLVICSDSVRKRRNSSRLPKKIGKGARQRVGGSSLATIAYAYATTDSSQWCRDSWFCCLPLYGRSQGDHGVAPLHSSLAASHPALC